MAATLPLPLTERHGIYWLVKERQMFRIFVTPSAKQAVEKFAAAFDMKEQGVASRVYQRFGQLPLEVQKWFVGLVDARESDGMRRFAESLMEAARPGATKAGPVFDVNLIDSAGNSLDESPEQSPPAGKSKGRGKKP